MVAISSSGSGEGPGWATAPGYSTAAFLAARPVTSDLATRHEKSSDPVVG